MTHIPGKATSHSTGAEGTTTAKMREKWNKWEKGRSVPNKNSAVSTASCCPPQKQQGSTRPLSKAAEHLKVWVFYPRLKPRRVRSELWSPPLVVGSDSNNWALTAPPCHSSLRFASYSSQHTALPQAFSSTLINGPRKAVSLPHCAFTSDSKTMISYKSFPSTSLSSCPILFIPELGWNSQEIDPNALFKGAIILQ